MQPPDCSAAQLDLIPTRKSRCLARVDRGLALVSPFAPMCRLNDGVRLS
jgi:hypothetical protein